MSGGKKFKYGKLFASMTCILGGEIMQEVT